MASVNSDLEDIRPEKEREEIEEDIERLKLVLQDDDSDESDDEDALHIDTNVYGKFS